MRTLSQLCYTIKQAHAFWTVLLGSHHPKVREYKKYRTYLVDHEMELHQAMRHDKIVTHLVPALLARRIHIDENIWLKAQARNPGHESVLSMVDVFH